jgi:hypothetical protein
MAPIETGDDEDFRAQFETNFWGVYNVSKAAIPALREQGGGLIIQFSSMPAALAAALTVAPLRRAASTAITVSTGCVVVRDAMNSAASAASPCATSVCTDLVVCTGSSCPDAEVCFRAACTDSPRVLGETGVTWDFALCVVGAIPRGVMGSNAAPT